MNFPECGFFAFNEKPPFQPLTRRPSLIWLAELTARFPTSLVSVIRLIQILQKMEGPYPVPAKKPGRLRHRIWRKLTKKSY